jgi:hypothetical protein
VGKSEAELLGGDDAVPERSLRRDGGHSVYDCAEREGQQEPEMGLLAGDVMV